MEQINLSKPDKGPEDNVKNVVEAHYKLSVGEVFATWYARNRNIYENRMAGLPNETRITMLLLKFNRHSRHIPITLLIKRGADFAATSISVKIVPSLNISARTEIRTDTRKDSARAVNDNRIQATGAIPIRLTIANASSDAVQHSGAVKCEATFKGKTVVIVCYVADRDINLVGLYWINMFNVLEPKIRSVICPQVRI
ncbi:hypothetical protein ACTXT7_012679 [Hymenolepis weldensis]